MNTDVAERLKMFAEMVRKAIDQVPVYGPITLQQPETFACQVDEAVNEIAQLRRCLKQLHSIAVGRMVGGQHSNEARLGAIEEQIRAEMLRSVGPNWIVKL